MPSHTGSLTSQQNKCAVNELLFCCYAGFTNKKLAQSFSSKGSLSKNSHFSKNAVYGQHMFYETYFLRELICWWCEVC
jgi:hypothetical protein